jgi:cytochrome oxidase Cu insertion factor (SCO1/SenC/PrrC family)
VRSKIVAVTLLLVISLACAPKLNSTNSGPSELKPRSSQLAVGEMAPDFTLEDHNNQKVTLSSARGARSTILVFYRGYW